MGNNQIVQHGNLLLIDVPEGAILDDEVSNGQVRYRYRDEKGLMHYTSTGFPLFPPGQWSIVGIASSLTEDMWKGILPQVRGGFAGHLAGYKDYNDNGLSMDKAPLKTATESGLSLLASHGKKPYTTLVILKNE